MRRMAIVSLSLLLQPNKIVIKQLQQNGIQFSVVPKLLSIVHSAHLKVLDWVVNHILTKNLTESWTTEYPISITFWLFECNIRFKNGWKNINFNKLVGQLGMQSEQIPEGVEREKPRSWKSHRNWIGEPVIILITPLGSCFWLWVFRLLDIAPFLSNLLCDPYLPSIVSRDLRNFFSVSRNGKFRMVDFVRDS
jgi:hypothetical protein